MSQTSQFFIRHGLPLVFVAVLVEQVGLPLPALPWLLAAGALSATGQFSFPIGVAVTVLACLIADASWFYLGRHWGNRVLGVLCRISLEPDSCVRRNAELIYALRPVGIAGSEIPARLGNGGTTIGRDERDERQPVPERGRGWVAPLRGLFSWPWVSL